MRFAAGDAFAHFVVVAPLGRGGMGQVYHARDTRLGRSVALKILQPHDDPADALSTGGAARLLREARAAAILDHPNVVRVYEVGEEEGSPFVSMELVVGRTLRELVGDASVPVRERVRILGEVARGLGAAHAAGLVHRDVKPENIMIRDDGVVKVLDFGLAKRASSSSTEAHALATVTSEGIAIGTPYYMAPEQMRCERLDGRADQFSWGVVAYELLAGVPPWGAVRDGLQLVSNILSMYPPPIAAANPEVPREVAMVVVRALAKERALRFESMAEIVQALDDAARVLAYDEAPPSAGPADPTALTAPVAHDAPTPAGALAEGDRFDRYHVEGLLGRGGMGEVHKAFDPKLQRRVALKILRGSEAAHERILREARAAAALAHPNVVAIYDVGSFRGIPFIAMELVEGRRLSRFVGDRSISTRKKTRWLLEIARALAAAHARGLVHRDVKPDNVLVCADDSVKVLDFGIAARAGEAGDAAVGTPRYMAPEQRDGRPADARSDQHAWGLVAQELVGDASDALRSAIARALAPDPKARFESMAAIVTLLESELDGERSGTAPLAGPDPAPVNTLGPSAQTGAKPIAGAWSFGRRWGIAGAAALVVGTTGAAFFFARPRAESAPPAAPPASAAAIDATDFHPDGPRRITYGDGCEEYPSFTPDGRHVVYDATEGAISSLFVRDLVDGTERRLTKVAGWDYAADVSPDGSMVAFVRNDGKSTGTFVVDIEGREPPRLVAVGSLRPSWSPDGRALWAGDKSKPTRFDAKTGDALRAIQAPRGYPLWMTLELPDGALVVNSITSATRGTGGIGLVSPDGAFRWLFQEQLNEVLALAPRGGAVITARRRDTGTAELMAIPLDGASPPRSLMTSGIMPEKGLKIAPDRSSVVWSTCRGVRQIAKLGADGALAAPQSTPDWEDVEAAWIPGTGDLAVLSTRDHSSAPWIIDAMRASQPRRIPSGDAWLADLAVSADGKELAAATRGGGLRALSFAGGEPRTLTTDPTDAKPTFRYGARELFFERDGGDGTPRVFSVPFGGGDARAVLDPGSRAPAASPTDDRMVYLRGREARRSTPTLHDLRTGAERPLSKLLPEGSYAAPIFSPDGRRVALVRGGMELVEVDVATGALLRSSSSGTDGLVRVLYVKDDLFVVRMAWMGDLWMADGPF